MTYKNLQDMLLHIYVTSSLMIFHHLVVQPYLKLALQFLELTLQPVPLDILEKPFLLSSPV